MSYNPTSTPGQKTMAASDPVVIASDQSAVPISGTVTANTGLNQPLTDTQLRATPVPISGAVTATTGDLTDTQLRATPVPVSGTVTATTGGLTDTQLRATAVPVSGTVAISNPTTNPETGLAKDGTDISSPTAMPAGGAGIRGWLSAIWTKLNGTITVSNGQTQPLTDTQLRASAVPVSLATNTPTLQSGSTTAVTQATGTNLHAVIDTGSTTAVTQATASNLNATVVGTGTFAVQAAATLAAETTKVIGTVNMAASQTIAVTQATPANLTATVTPITITKGTQGATGFTVQPLRDAGRSSVMVTASVASTATTETLITISKSLALAAVTTASSNTITTGKKFRIQGIYASARNTTGTTAGVATIKFRAAVAGATTTASPLQITTSVALPAATTTVNFPDINIPDSFEIDSNSVTNTWGLTITHPQWVTASVVATFDITLIGYEY